MNIAKSFQRLIVLSLAGLLTFLLLSCSLGSFSGSKEAANDEYGYQLAEEDNARVGSMLAKSAPIAASEEMAGEIFDDANPPSNDKADSQRKRVYNGSAGLVVDNIEDSRIYLEGLATSSGGYVESSYSDYVVIRVPAEKFNEVFEQILDAGKLEYSRVETLDVTEYFSDIDRLLNTARETRERLYVLLDKSTDPEERAKVLREIGRLTEEISSLEQQMELLQARISLSRISVQLIPRSPNNGSREDIPFRWISSLDPLMPAGSKLKAKVDLNLGSEWAVFSKDEIYMAENGDRNHLLISTISNNPRGDGAFWGRALSHSLNPYYASIEEKEIQFGNSTVFGVELVSKDRDSFRYFVGIVPDGRDLHVVEIFSPDSGGSFENVYRALSEGGIR